jgi:hypothetical protein
VKRNRRSSKGASFAELAVSSFLVIILCGFACDICLLIFGCSVNDRACRDATRAAAQAADSAKAWQLADGSVKNHKTDGVMISPVKLITVNYNDYGGNPPAGECPYVSVWTQVQVKLPVPLYFFGASFANDMTYTQCYTSPIVRTRYVLP